LKVHLNNSICAAVPSQYAALEALTNARDYPKVMNEAYLKRRDYVYSRLVDMGCDVKKPGGAFYIFPDISFTGMEDWDFATALLKDQHLAVVPGSAFSEHGKGHIRISFASAIETLEEGMDRLEAFVKTLTKQYAFKKINIKYLQNKKTYVSFPGASPRSLTYVFYITYSIFYFFFYKL